MRLGGNPPFPKQVRERAVALYWSSERMTCAAVARIVGCSEETVRRWIHDAGEGGRSRHLGPVRPPAKDRLTGDQIADLAERMMAIEVRLDDLEVGGRNVEGAADFELPLGIRF